MTHFREELTARGIDLSGTDVATDEEAAELLFGLGRAQVAILPVDQLHNAVDTLRRAFEYYSEMHELDRAVAIAETPIPPTAGHHIGMSQLLARALELVPATSLAAGRLLSLRGRSYIESVDPEEVSHMLFAGGIASLTSIFATHPPLTERILALDPNFSEGDYPDVDPRQRRIVRESDQAAGFAGAAVTPHDSTAVTSNIAEAYTRCAT